MYPVIFLILIQPILLLFELGRVFGIFFLAFYHVLFLPALLAQLFLRLGGNLLGY